MQKFILTWEHNSFFHVNHITIISNHISTHLSVESFWKERCKLLLLDFAEILKLKELPHASEREHNSNYLYSFVILPSIRWREF